MMNEGLYFGKRFRHGHGQAREKGTPFIYVEFEITHIASGGAWVPVPSPGKRTVNMYLTDSAYETTCAKLDSLGFNGDFKNPDFAPETQTVGVELRCTHETYEGKNREKWELENWGGGREQTPIADTSILDVLTARYRQEKAAPTPPAPGGGKPGALPTTPPPMAGARPGVPAGPAAGSKPTPPPVSGTGSGPPPIKGPPPVSTKQVRTREQVWDAATKAHPSAPTDVMVMEWQKALVELRPGKSESDFTGEDWYAVEARLVAPF